ncbi:hypothetical protein [Streptomyces sp. NPDC008150]|uniref:hypothetical protein n=1 Tax=Streptomyces sp. NPDC008150 TaxID=3364816 RepID=UPI0036E5979C
MTATRPHGNAKCHLERCRRTTCCQGAHSYDCARRRAIAYGRWQPYVAAEPVQLHVRMLGEFGIGWMRLAYLAGGSQLVIRRDLRRGRRRPAPERAAKGRLEGG